MPAQWLSQIWIDLGTGFGFRAAHDPRATAARGEGQEGDAVGFELRDELVLDDPGLADRARSLGIDVAVWTVDTPDEASVLRSAGVTRFTTNEVAVLMDWSRSSA